VERVPVLGHFSTSKLAVSVKMPESLTPKTSACMFPRLAAAELFTLQVELSNRGWPIIADAVPPSSLFFTFASLAGEG